MAKFQIDTLIANVNEALLQNGWDYEDRKRVTFMLRSRKPPSSTDPISEVIREEWDMPEEDEVWRDL